MVCTTERPAMYVTFMTWGGLTLMRSGLNLSKKGVVKASGSNLRTYTRRVPLYNAAGRLSFVSRGLSKQLTESRVPFS